MKLEELIARHRPSADREDDPAGDSQLGHLNEYRLLGLAIRRQLEKDGLDPSAVIFDVLYPVVGPHKGPKPAVVITKLTAWEILAEAQRNGLRIVPTRSR